MTRFKIEVVQYMLRKTDEKELGMILASWGCSSPYIREAIEEAKRLNALRS